MLQMEAIPSRAESYDACECLRRGAECKFMQAYKAFGDAIDSVGYIYWSGMSPDGKLPFLISSLIRNDSDLIVEAKHYKLLLRLIHASGFRIPSKMLADWTMAFVRVLRHCADMNRWDLFDKLRALTEDCLSFIARTRVSDMDSDAYAARLDLHFGEIIQLIVNDIRLALIRRETDIGLHIATPLPAPDGFYYPFGQAPCERSGTIAHENDKPAPPAVNLTDAETKTQTREAFGRFLSVEEGGFMVLTDCANGCKPYRIRLGSNAYEPIHTLLNLYRTGTVQSCHSSRKGWKGALQHRKGVVSDAARFKDEQIFMLPRYDHEKQTWPEGKHCGKWRLYTDDEMKMSPDQRIAKVKKDHPHGIP